jgi:DNA-binding GntR family transcriptional regulator
MGQHGQYFLSARYEFLVALRGKGPLYRHIYFVVRETILSGEIRSGALLPATCEFVQVLHISSTTILDAYADLAVEG